MPLTLLGKNYGCYIHKNPNKKRIPKKESSFGGADRNRTDGQSFADSCLNHLATAPYRNIFYIKSIQ